MIVDGMNVLGSRPDGWWKDRPAAMERLARRLDAFAAATAIDMTVVFDGNEHARVSGAARSIAIGFAPGGRDSADREIVRRIRGDADPASLVAVTSDRRLRAAVKAANANSISAGELLRRLERQESNRDHAGGS